MIDAGNSQGYARHTSTGDVNGDTLVDLYVSNDDEGDNQLFIGHRDANTGAWDGFEEQKTGVAVESGGRSQHSAMTDINGDGRVDLLVSNGKESDMQTNHLFLGVVQGTTSAFVNVDTAAAVTALGVFSHCVVQDFNGDGAVDLYISSAMEGKNNSLYLGNRGIHSTHVVEDPPSESSTHVAMGDVNGDAIIDLYVAPNAYRSNRLFLGDADGNEGYTEETQGSAVNEASLSIHTAMVDLDGDENLISSAMVGKTNFND